MNEKKTPKPFNRATIEPMDDGTFTVEISMPEKPKKEDKAGNSPIEFYAPKKFTAETLEGAFEKISGCGNGEEEESEEAPEEGRMKDLMRNMQSSLGKTMKGAKDE